MSQPYYLKQMALCRLDNRQGMFDGLGWLMACKQQIKQALPIMKVHRQTELHMDITQTSDDLAS